MESKRILIVEDEPDFAEMLGLRLEMAGYQAVIAEDAYQGNKALINQSFDLLVLDLLMPVGGGFGLLAHLRKNRKTRNLPVIILTGRTIDDEVIAEAGAHGVSAIFTKPYDPERFLSKIRELTDSL